MEYRCSECQAVMLMIKDVARTEVILVRPCQCSREEYDIGYADGYEEGYEEGCDNT